MPSASKYIFPRLALMTFLEFGVWGAYLISLGNFLGHTGLATRIGWFYAVQCVISLFMPALAGYIADRYIPAHRMLTICHLLFVIFMGSAGCYALTAPGVEFWPLFGLYTAAVGCFMPTVALSNAVTLSTLRKMNLNTATCFPRIRIFGTVGFIGAMLLVNFTQFQTNAWQLVTAAAISLLLALYSFTLPDVPVRQRDKTAGQFSGNLAGVISEMFHRKNTAVFFLFAVLIGVALQITNSYGNLYISSFSRLPEFSGTWGARNANALISISQISEALCILLLPFCIRKFGIKNVILIAITAWSARFAMLGAGNTGSGLWLIILSCIVYGIAFDFFNIAGSMYADRLTVGGNRSSAQGLFMAMSAGIGGSAGLLIAQGVGNRLVFAHASPESQHIGWETSWFVFAGYALAVAILFSIFFKEDSSAQR